MFVSFGVLSLPVRNESIHFKGVVVVNHFKATCPFIIIYCGLSSHSWEICCSRSVVAGHHFHVLQHRMSGCCCSFFGGYAHSWEMSCSHSVVAGHHFSRFTALDVWLLLVVFRRIRPLLGNELLPFRCRWPSFITFYSTGCLVAAARFSAGTLTPVLLTSHLCNVLCRRRLRLLFMVFQAKLNKQS